MKGSKKLWGKCIEFENNIVSNESSVNELDQSGRRNNIVISAILGPVSERDLDETISLLCDIEVNISANDVEACHGTGKTGGKKSEKIVHFVIRKHCQKALLN